MQFKNTAIFILRIIIGATFIFSSITKMMEPNSFFTTIAKFNIINGEIIRVIGYMLIFSEYILGTLLILGIYIKHVSGILGVLTITFLALIIYSMSVGNITECGCFGSFSKREIGFPIIIQDVIILVIILVINRSNNWVYACNNFQAFFNTEKNNKINYFLVGLLLLNGIFYYCSKYNVSSSKGLANIDKQIDYVNNLPKYGDHIPRFSLNTYNKAVINDGELTEKPTIFAFYPADQDSAYYNVVKELYSKYDSSKTNWLVILKNWDKKINSYENRKAIKYINKGISLVIDTTGTIGKTFNLPNCKCPVFIATDRNNIVRLSQVTPEISLIDSTYSRMKRGEYEK